MKFIFFIRSSSVSWKSIANPTGNKIQSLQFHSSIKVNFKWHIERRETCLLNHIRRQRDKQKMTSIKKTKTRQRRRRWRRRREKKEKWNYFIVARRVKCLCRGRLNISHEQKCTSSNWILKWNRIVSVRHANKLMNANMLFRNGEKNTSKSKQDRKKKTTRKMFEMHRWTNIRVLHALWTNG